MCIIQNQLNIFGFLELEMSKLSSSSPDEDSCCESDENYAIKDEVEPIKRDENVRQRNQNQNASSSNHNSKSQEQQNRDTIIRDDETKSNLNFEERPVCTSTPSSSPISIISQDKMRRRLQFFFMNPIEKWQAKRR